MVLLCVKPLWRKAKTTALMAVMQTIDLFLLIVPTVLDSNLLTCCLFKQFSEQMGIMMTD